MTRVYAVTGPDGHESNVRAKSHGEARAQVADRLYDAGWVASMGEAFRLLRVRSLGPGAQTAAEVEDAAESAAVVAWNDACPVGTSVLFWPAHREGLDGRPSRTRTVAYRHSARGKSFGPAMVMVNDYTGGICLSHVDVMT